MGHSFLLYNESSSLLGLLTIQESRFHRMQILSSGGWFLGLLFRSWFVLSLNRRGRFKIRRCKLKRLRSGFSDWLRLAELCLQKHLKVYHRVRLHLHSQLWLHLSLHSLDFYFFSWSINFMKRRFSVFNSGTFCFGGFRLLF